MDVPSLTAVDHLVQLSLSLDVLLQYFGH
jgi:hypothetical protein